MRDLDVTCQTAAKYLDLLAEGRFLCKVKLNYINQPFSDLLSGQDEK